MEPILTSHRVIRHTGPMKQATKEDDKERTTVMLNRKLLADATAALNGKSASDTIEKALQLVVQQKAMEELAAIIAQPDPTFTAAPRRKAQ